jgi:hypothetical protein
MGLTDRIQRDSEKWQKEQLMNGGFGICRS